MNTLTVSALLLLIACSGSSDPDGIQELYDDARIAHAPCVGVEEFEKRWASITDTIKAAGNSVAFGLLLAQPMNLAHRALDSLVLVGELRGPSQRSVSYKKDWAVWASVERDSTRTVHCWTSDVQIGGNVGEALIVPIARESEMIGLRVYLEKVQSSWILLGSRLFNLYKTKYGNPIAAVEHNGGYDYFWLSGSMVIHLREAGIGSLEVVYEDIVAARKINAAIDLKHHLEDSLRLRRTLRSI